VSVEFHDAKGSKIDLPPEPPGGPESWYVVEKSVVASRRPKERRRAALVGGCRGRDACRLPQTSDEGHEVDDGAGVAPGSDRHDPIRKSCGTCGPCHWRPAAALCQLTADRRLVPGRHEALTLDGMIRDPERRQPRAAALDLATVSRARDGRPRARRIPSAGASYGATVR